MMTDEQRQALIDIQLLGQEMDAMTDAPKPCPFCGSIELNSGGDDKFVGYWCTNCSAIGPNHYDSRHDWNTRSNLCVSKEEIEALAERWDNRSLNLHNGTLDVAISYEVKLRLTIEADAYKKCAAELRNLMEGE